MAAFRARRHLGSPWAVDRCRHFGTATTLQLRFPKYAPSKRIERPKSDYYDGNYEDMEWSRRLLAGPLNHHKRHYATTPHLHYRAPRRMPIRLSKDHCQHYERMKQLRRLLEGGTKAARVVSAKLISRWENIHEIEIPSRSLISDSHRSVSSHDPQSSYDTVSIEYKGKIWPVGSATDTYVRKMYDRIKPSNPQLIYNNRWKLSVVRADDKAFVRTHARHIVISDGVIEQERATESLGFVLSHEYAHVILGHNSAFRLEEDPIDVDEMELRELAKQMSKKGGAEDAKSIYALLKDVLILMPRSRQQEYEADWLGLELAHNAGFKLDGIAQRFKAIQEQIDISDEKCKLDTLDRTLADLLSTHPPDKHRAAAAERRIEELRSGKHKSKQEQEQKHWVNWLF